VSLERVEAHQGLELVDDGGDGRIVAPAPALGIARDAAGVAGVLDVGPSAAGVNAGAKPAGEAGGEARRRRWRGYERTRE
jgi:hypothetical protein